MIINNIPYLCHMSRLKISRFTVLVDLYLLENGAEAVSYKDKGYVVYKYKSKEWNTVFITVPHFQRYIYTVFVKFQFKTKPDRTMRMYNKETQEKNFFSKRKSVTQAINDFQEWFEFLKNNNE